MRMTRLQPYMSAETLQFHHDKHHQAYVDMANKLVPGSKYEGKSIEEICKLAYADKSAADHQQRRSGLQSHPLLAVDEEGRRRQ